MENRRRKKKEEKNCRILREVGEIRTGEKNDNNSLKSTNID